MIMAAFLLAFALAFGFGARSAVDGLLKTYFARRTFELGQKIEYNNSVYEIELIENMSVVLKNDTEKIIVPIKDIVESQIKVRS